MRAAPRSGFGCQPRIWTMFRLPGCLWSKHEICAGRNIARSSQSHVLICELLFAEPVFKGVRVLCLWKVCCR